MDNIRKIELTNVAEGETVDTDCPFMELSRCARNNVECNFGLTDISVPERCPLRNGSVIMMVSLLSGHGG